MMLFDAIMKELMLYGAEMWGQERQAAHVQLKYIIVCWK